MTLPGGPLHPGLLVFLLLLLLNYSILSVCDNYFSPDYFENFPTLFHLCQFTSLSSSASNAFEHCLSKIYFYRITPSLQAACITPCKTSKIKWQTVLPASLHTAYCTACHTVYHTAGHTEYCTALHDVLHNTTTYKCNLWSEGQHQESPSCSSLLGRDTLTT